MLGTRDTSSDVVDSFAIGTEATGGQQQQERKHRSFQVGDSCFTDSEGCIRSGTILQLPARGRQPKLYRIKLDTDNEEDDEAVVVTVALGSLFHPEDKVPAMKKTDKRTQEVSPWKTSRAKEFYRKRRLLDDNDSIHGKTEQEIFNTSIYDDGEPVVRTKYTFAKFKVNFKRLKDTNADRKAAATADNAALELEQRLYPPPATDFHGNPYYAGSKIRSSLIGDVKSGVAASSGMKPLEIIASREEYAPFQNASKSFRNYLYRERRKESESAGWQIRRNKQGYRQHEKEHEEATRKSNNAVG